MNIFYLDSNPQVCAEYHYDRHVVKMILEYAQILSTTHHVLNPEQTEFNALLYKKTHVKHPAVIWACESAANYNWLYQLWHALLSEYTYRYGKQHASRRLLVPLSIVPANLIDIGLTPFKSIMEAEYIISDDAKVNYRNYYVNGKQHLCKYTRRVAPYWLNDKKFKKS